MGNDGVKITKGWQSWIGWKNAIMQVTYFLKDPMFNLLLYCPIILYWEKVTCEKFSHNLTLIVQIAWKDSALYCHRWKYQKAEK